MSDGFTASGDVADPKCKCFGVPCCFCGKEFYFTYEDMMTIDYECTCSECFSQKGSSVKEVPNV